MDTKALLSEIKARFNHNTNKEYLKNKYKAKLILADQGGLWEINPTLLMFLATTTTEHMVLLDQYENPIRVNVKTLLSKATETYNTVMNDWHEEYKLLENKR
jgi:hypothetical protein